MVLLLGTWLFLSPFLLPERSGTATLNAHLIGLALVTSAALALVESRLWESWLYLVLGAWLVVSPYVLGFTHQPASAWNAILVGFGVGADALSLILRREVAETRPTR